MDRSSRFWNRIADRYATRAIDDPNAYERKLAITRSYLHTESRVLELGCGTGSTAIAHAPYASHICACDFSSRMIEIARQKAEMADVRNVEFICVDEQDLNIGNDDLDAVLALNFLHLLEDWHATIVDAHRMLKPGGVLVTSTMCMKDGFGYLRPVLPLGRFLGFLPRVSFFTRVALERALVEAGFQIVENWQPRPKAGVFHVARKLS